MMKDSTTRQLKYFNPYNEIWNNILLYTNVGMTKRILAGNHRKLGADLLKRKCTDIKQTLLQAKEYFDASQNVSIISKPTLIYYGIISLAVSLIIFRKREKSIDSLVHSHGLSMTYSADLSSGKNIVKGTSLKIGNRGGFTELIDFAISDRITLKWEVKDLVDSTKSFKEEYLLGNKVVGSKYSLNELLLSIPDLWKEVSLFFGEQAYVQGEPYIILENSKELLCFRFAKNSETLTEILRMDNYVNNNLNQFGETKDYLFYRATNIDLPKLKVCLNGEILYPLGNKELMSDLHLYYLVYFILGSIARYKPNIWENLLSQQSQVYKLLLDKLCNLALIKVPLLFLSEIEDCLIKL